MEIRMIRLSIHHNIHLNEEQRYGLHQGKNVNVVGFSIPVWHLNNFTSEPAKEVFCNYYIKNPKKEIPIKILTDGYEINLPYREGKKIEISEEEYQKLLFENRKKLDEMYSKTIKEVSSKNLLNIKDGGSEFLYYRELNTVLIGKKNLQIMHHVSIDCIKKLEKSF
jgi:hypothetical protein